MLCRIKPLSSLIIVVYLLTAFQTNGQDAPLEKQIINEFQRDFDEIVRFAKENPRPIAYETLMGFIDQHLMQRWSSELTIRAIMGRDIWAGLKQSEQTALIEAYSNTMRRYLYETFQKYEGQKPIATSVQLNTKQNKGWLTTKLELEKLPDLSVDLKIYSHNNQWVIYDFRFQGISFIKLKELEYRAYVQEKGVQALIGNLNDKYAEFLATLDTSNE